MKYNVFFLFLLFILALSCAQSKEDISSSDDGQPSALIVSSQRNFDSSNTQFTLSSCTDSNGSVTFVSSAQSSNHIVLPME